MARDSRRSSGVAGAAAETAAAVAARVLEARLGSIGGLVRAAVDGRQAIEAVHDLRVATRRAAAALDGFRPLLSRRRSAWFGERLDGLRRAAGKARDLDGLAASLEGGPHGGAARLDDVARSRVLTMIKTKRARAQRAIDKVAHRFPGKKAWRARIGKLVDGIKPGDHRLRFDRFAERRLARTLGRFLSAAAAGAPDTATLHALRILAKKGRYAIEIFGSTGPSRPWGDCRAMLEHFQDLAGLCIDQAAAAEWCARWARQADLRADRRLFTTLAKTATEEAEVARKRAIEWLTPARLAGLEQAVARLRNG